MFNIRSRGFWALDSLRGGTIRQHLNDIREKNESSVFGDEKLKELLAHATHTVPYYDEMMSLEIRDYPIITKDDIKRNYDSFKSELYKEEVTHSMSTSGSTGTPFVIQQDMNKRKRTIAELIYFNSIAGQELGERYLYIKAFPEKRSFIERLKQNVIPIDILQIDEQKLEEIRSILLRDKSIRSVLAYASTYEQLSSYMYKHGDDPSMFNLNALFSSSAVLPLQTKEQLTAIFGCPVIDRYSNQENGVLAQTKGTKGDFHINRASYYVELLKIDSDEAAEAGELGRIVLTDLYNYAMPMIRYDTGDLAISDNVDRSSLRSIKSIQGRRVDAIYDTKGTMLTPHTWGVNMRKYTKLKQWQFIQNDRNEYILKVNGAEGIYSVEDFERTLKGVLGQDANIEVIYVDDIPVLASGKFKNTICNYDPSKNGKQII